MYARVSLELELGPVCKDAVRHVARVPVQVGRVLQEVPAALKAMYTTAVFCRRVLKAMPILKAMSTRPRKLAASSSSECSGSERPSNCMGKMSSLRSYVAGSFMMRSSRCSSHRA